MVAAASRANLYLRGENCQRRGGRFAFNVGRLVLQLCVLSSVAWHLIVLSPPAPSFSPAASPPGWSDGEETVRCQPTLHAN